MGLTIKPGTAPEALSPYLDQLDLVLVMSVEPGFGGQKFMPSALEKLRWLREERAKRSAHFLLEVDGGVDDTTAPALRGSGGRHPRGGQRRLRRSRPGGRCAPSGRSVRGAAPWMKL